MKKMTYIIIGIIILVGIIVFAFLSKKCFSVVNPSSGRLVDVCHYIWQSNWWRRYEKINELKQSIGKEIQIEGKAMDTKGGAVLITDDGMVYIEGTDYWPEDLINQNIAMEGKLSFKEYISESKNDKNGLTIQGSTANNQYVLEDANLIIIN